MLRRITTLVVLAVLLVGCFGPQRRPTATTKEANVIIRLNWSHFDNPKIMGTFSLSASNANEKKPSHVGARLVYPNDGAVFTQSKAREQAEQEGVISMRVPASSLANLFVVAVTEGDVGLRSGRVIQFGTLPNLVIDEDTTLIVDMDEIHWQTPFWGFVDDVQGHEIYAGSVVADKDSEALAIPIFVHDPFQAGEQLDYSNLLIGVAGGGRNNSSVGTGPSDTETMTRTFDVFCKNENVGEENISSCWFGPYLKGDRFNLPNGYYLPPVINDFTVSWQ